MEVVCVGVATSSSDEVNMAATSRRRKESVEEEKTVPIQRELLAAEEFERTSNCNVEFDFHID